jgi:hypothetical protein
MKRSRTTRDIGPTARLVESRKTSLAVDSTPVRTVSLMNTGSPTPSAALAPDSIRETSLLATSGSADILLGVGRASASAECPQHYAKMNCRNVKDNMHIIRRPCPGLAD